MTSLPSLNNEAKTPILIIKSKKNADFRLQSNRLEPWSQRVQVPFLKGFGQPQGLSISSVTL